MASFGGSDRPPSYDFRNDSRPPPAYELASIDTALPIRFGIYSKTGTLHPSTAVLAENESTPLYHVSLGIGLLEAGLDDVALHAGVDAHSPVVASSKRTSTDCGHRIQLNGSGNIPIITEAMNLSSRRLSRKYTFAVDCESSEAQGGRKRRQVFEWRPSKGKEVRSLGLRDYGWKLVWLGDAAAAANGASGDPGEDPEVVAVWSRYSDARSKKILGFGFMDDNITERFGKTGCLMAVITALAIWHTEIID